MNKNKYLTLIAVGLLCASNGFAALTVKLTRNTSDTTGYSGANGGGEFKAVTSGNGTFQTFCIDAAHGVSTGSTYNYEISQQTFIGSLNNISIGTAWLYDQFLSGGLTGYSYTDGVANKTSATSLQSIFWGLEGMSYGTSASYFVTGNTFYDAVVAQFGSIAAAQVDAGANNIYGVAAMNLYTYDRDHHKILAQSQLVRFQPSNIPPSIPEPSTIIAGALLLLPFGVSTLRIVRRKQAAQD